MRAVVMEEFGGPEVLRIREVPDPEPQPGQVVVAVAYASITFVETQVRSGRGPFSRPGLPRVPGNGVGGRVVAVGSGVDPVLVGTIVVTTTGGEGGYAELATARAQDLVPVPEGVALGDAVALLADGRTALWLYRQANVHRDEHVLVEAAAGGVGSLLVQLASADGARVIGAARGAWKAEPVMGLGAAAVVDYSRPGWLDRVRAVTGGRGLDLVFDGVGGAVGTQAVRALRDGGRVSVYGMASGTDAEHDPAELRARSIEVIGLTSAPSPAEARALIADALDMNAAGTLRPLIGQTFRLDQAAAAQRAIEARTTLGKTLLTVDNPREG
ncbi:zinc-binding dehydrogenase [Amycolatopsis granulosa]|uniref:zinc-binding dehydrogenase n=1 Tax=Amycolatopsis granulosa TaxID=185684 RepID=UPI00141EA4E5|nr:zinc-binding dehydrogenase [Amycolatopsis granulosa]NIH83506.1 NADPH2:quinone reductase [Amycolatopsis granulosa]